MTSPAVTETNARTWQRRSLPVRSSLALVLPGAAVLGVAAANGGFFPTAFGWTGLAFAWVTIIAAVAVAPRWGLFDAPWALAAAAFCVFTFCSALWAGSAGTTIDQGLRAVVYATAVAGALLLLRRRDLERWLFGLVLGAAAICFYSLTTRLFAGHFGAFDAGASYRLYVPIGYWNALGIFAVLAALLAFGLAVLGRTAALRIVAAVALIVLLPTLYYTYSRGSWAALIVGLVAALLYSPYRERLFVALLVFGALPALAVWLASRPAALTNRLATISAAAHAGHRVAIELVVLGVAQALLAAAYVLLADRIAFPRMLRNVLALAVLVALLAGVAGIFAAYGSPSKIAHRVSHAFTGPPTSGQNLNSRLFSLSNNGRTVLWRSAWNEFVAHPVAGGGAGTFQRWWFAHRRSAYYVQDAHNLYAQTLGELGAVGGVLLALFLGLPLVAARRARAHPLAATALGAYLAYLAHCIVDWDWQMPAVTLLALFAGAALVAAARSDGVTPPEPVRRSVRLAIGALAGLAALVAFVGLIGNIALAKAQTAIQTYQPGTAVTQARRAHRWAPWSAEALRYLGAGELLIGQKRAGLADLKRAVAKDPGDWESWFYLASATSSGPTHAEAVARVRALNPHGPEVALLEHPPAK